MQDTKTCWSKIVQIKKIYNFDFDHFLIKCTVFVLNVKNVIKNQKFNFLDKIATYKKNVEEQNCSFQKDVQILLWSFFDRNYSFSYKHEKCY